MEKEENQENLHKVAKVTYVAKGGARGIKLEGEDNVWYNPDNVIKDDVTAEKYQGKMVDLYLKEAGSRVFVGITLLDDLKDASEHTQEAQSKPESTQVVEKVETPVKTEKVAQKANEEVVQATKPKEITMEKKSEGKMTQADVEALMKTKLETEKKGPMKLTYASWAEVWSELKKLHPNAEFKVYENENGMPYFADHTGGFVKVGITINGLEHISHLPIMDNSNRSIAHKEIDTFAINKSIQRALAKAGAMHGLGLYVYKGEDFPED